MNGFVILCCVVAGAMVSVAPGQSLIDDAGSTRTTAGLLHVGENTCAFEFQVPRAIDVDVWALPTVIGKVYRVTPIPIDDLSESVAALEFAISYSTPVQLERDLGFSGGSEWVRGDGRPEFFTLRGLARRDGQPVRYRITVEEFDDPGDNEPDALADGIVLSDGVWFDGTLSAPRPTVNDPSTMYLRASPEFDAFRFFVQDRGVYRIERETEPGINLPQLSQFSVQRSQTVPVALFSDEYSRLGHVFECRGDGIIGFTLSRTSTNTLMLDPYRVRITRIGTAPPDDHGDTPINATALLPGGPIIRGSGLSMMSIPFPRVQTWDEDWFAVPTVPGHIYEVRCEKGPRRSGYTLSFFSDGGEGPTRLYADAVLAPHVISSSSNSLLGSLRFRGRQGAPVRFGVRANGTYTLRAIDLGEVNDDGGDPLTGSRTLSMVVPSATSVLETPKDIDSFTIEPPTVPGYYKLRCVAQVPSTVTGYVAGMAVVQRGYGGQMNRQDSWHLGAREFVFTRRTDGTIDSFPVRIDLLCKPWPSITLPDTGPAVTYTLTLIYDGPLPIVNPPETPPDDAPSTRDGAPVLAPGEFLQLARQGSSDTVDSVLVALERDHLYRVSAWYTSGTLYSPSGMRIPTTPSLSESGSYLFSVSEDGLYLQQQNFLADAGGYGITFLAGVTDLGPISDDRPNDTNARRLLEGVTLGTLDYAGDRDRFVLPAEEDAFYRVTLAAPFPMALCDDSGPIGNDRPMPIVLRWFVPESILTPQGLRFSVASNSTATGTYDIHVEKLIQFHPSDDQPELPGMMTPLITGVSAVVVRNRPFDIDVLDFEVHEGHTYHWRVTSADPSDSTTMYLMGQTFDAQGHSVSIGDTLDVPIHATGNEVWHVRIDPWTTPLRLTLIDDGLLPDDFGTGDRNAGHVPLDGSASGIIERQGDVDGWIIDGSSGDEERTFNVNLIDLDRGTNVSFLAYSTAGGNARCRIQSEWFSAQPAFPIRYDIRTSNVQISRTSIGCMANLGTTGGVPNNLYGTGGDGVLDNNDFVAFITLFFTNNNQADLGHAGGAFGPDGWLDQNDFVAFIDLFFSGCF